MKRSPACVALLALFLAIVPSALAHPGHEGHELTWDFNHLAAHPLATISCFIVIGAMAWMGWRALQPAASAKTVRQKR